MIELVLQTSAEDYALVCDAVREMVGIEVANSELAALYQRTDLDALILGEHLAVEYLLARPARTLGWVTLDLAIGTRCLVYKATVSPGKVPDAQLRVAASWIVVVAHFAPPANAGGGNPAEVEAADLGRSSILSEEVEYPLLLNTLEVMEQHNAAGAQSPIHRAAIMVDPRRMPSVLHAYGEYYQRVQAGIYQAR